MSCKRYHIIFSTFSLKFKCKICVRKEVIHNFKNHELRTTSYELTHFKKMVRAWKAKSLLFCLRYDPLIVFGRQNHITFIFIKTMSRDPLVQMAYSKFPTSIPTTFICGVPPPPPGGDGLPFVLSWLAVGRRLNFSIQRGQPSISWVSRISFPTDSLSPVHCPLPCLPFPLPAPQPVAKSW